MDHPHACGDKPLLHELLQCTAGSSPRVWGQGGLHLVDSGRRMDHPHACGDKCFKIYFLTRLKGSSPRVWGQAAILLDNERLRGIIPTRVGTRAKRKTATGGLEDHPHACGDKEYRSFMLCSITGSSPRVWGQD